MPALASIICPYPIGRDGGGFHQIRRPVSSPGRLSRQAEMWLIVRDLTSVSSSLTLRGREHLAVSGYDALEFPADRQVGWIEIPSLDLSLPAQGSVYVPRLPTLDTLPTDDVEAS
ncbi:MAG: hypothetical protein LUQ29_15575 [Methylococcaceae bacterium]|nr:hypothetical protein [Methylococcaceae bacterium]